MGSIFPKREARRDRLAHDCNQGNATTDQADDTETTEQLLAELKRDPRKELALKAGYVSLQERLGNWARQASVSPTVEAKDRSLSSKTRATAPASHECHQQTGQFATLQEFFQSKSSLRAQMEQDELLRHQKRARAPIMKLTKEDWNVKCWEERFRKGPRQSNERTASKENKSSPTSAAAIQPNRAKKLERQLEVFHGRIEEVAKKLDKVREGEPIDEQLYKLKVNKLREAKREHSWTDLLKSELTEGVHNAKILKSKLQTKFDDTSQDDADCASIATTATATTARRRFMKSPLGRPIGRIDQDDDDDSDA